MSTSETVLARANRLLREGRFKESLSLYEAALQEMPKLAHHIRFNMRLAEKWLAASPSTGQRIFFLHIPKTAGSSINAYFRTCNTYFRTTVEASQYCEHLEGNPDWIDPLQRQRLVERCMFLSGHITHAEAVEKLDLPDWFVFTCLREPKTQLVSHLAYVRNLAEPSEKSRFDEHSLEVQELAVKLAEIDLSNPTCLAKLLDHLSPHGVNFFHNTQTRFLGSKPPSTGLVTENDLATALENIAQLDFVAFTETIDADLPAIAHYLGLEHAQESVPKENVAKNKFGLDPRNEEQMKALMPLIEYDIRLYQAAKALRQGFLPKALRHIAIHAFDPC